MIKNLKKSTEIILRELKDLAGTNENSSVFKRSIIHQVAVRNGFTPSAYVPLLTKSVRRGYYDLSEFLDNTDHPVNSAPAHKAESPAVQMTTSVTSIMSEECYIPQKDGTFVPWGSFKDIKDVIESGMFYPIYISGLSGNGKTMMVKQACARLGRQYIRVQINPETDEDDLIGGFRLIDDNTVFAKGPVIKAMEQGAVLLLDEIDRASTKIMCLQGILEGDPVLINKTGEVVIPKPGFTIIATGNTKGRGSEDGRYSAAGIIDDAFLERFTASIDQPFPSMAVEKKIAINHMKKYECEDNDFLEKLVTWTEIIHKTYEADGIDEFISTRRLCHIVQSYSIFKDRLKAIEMCISRFDAEIKMAFLDFYTKIDDGTLKSYEDSSPEKEEECPF